MAECCAAGNFAPEIRVVDQFVVEELSGDDYSAAAAPAR